LVIRSRGIALLGGSLLLGSYLLLALLPAVSPFHVQRCFSSSCFSSLNPVYPFLFVVSILGTAVLFYGLRGRGFVLNRVFVVSMVALEYGLAAIVSALLSSEDPSIFLPFLAIGTVGIGYHTYRSRGRVVTDPIPR
jgi:hypothetical protein